MQKTKQKIEKLQTNRKNWSRHKKDLNPRTQSTIYTHRQDWRNQTTVVEKTTWLPQSTMISRKPNLLISPSKTETSQPLIDSGSACSILIKSLAARIVSSNTIEIWVNENNKPQLRTIPNELTQIEVKIRTPVTSNGCYIPSSTFTVVADGLKPLISGDCFIQLGLAVRQHSSQKGNQVNNISPYCVVIEKVALPFPNLVSRIGRSKNHLSKSPQTFSTTTPKCETHSYLSSR